MRLSIVILIALGLRVIYLLQVKSQGWFIAPGMDPAFYAVWAEDILNGDASNYIPFPRAPLYAYLLAVIKGILGDSWLIPRMLNILADIISIATIYFITKRIAGNTPAVYTAMIFACAGVTIYYSGEILMTSIATSLMAALLFALITYNKKPSILYATLSGGILAFFSLLRPNVLLLIPITLMLIMKANHNETKSKLMIVYGVSHLGTILLILSPALIVNFQATYKLIPVSTQGGVNFYIGNAEDADGWSSTLPGVGADWSDHDVRTIAELDAGRNLTITETGSQLWKMGFREILESPLGWTELMLKKILLVINRREIGNNRPLSLASEASPVMKILFTLSIGLLLPFILLASLMNRTKPEIRIIILLSSVYAISIVVFFVNSRYRMPLLPVAAILGGIGLDYFVSIVKEKRRPQKMQILVFTTGIILALPFWVGSKFENSAQSEYIAGNGLLRIGDYEEALNRYKTALKAEPNYRNLNLNMGVAYLSLGDTASAEEVFIRELERHPSNLRALNNLGAIAEQRHNIERAEQLYNQALSISPHYTDARLNLGRVLLKLGDKRVLDGEIEQARQNYIQADNFIGSDPRPHYRLALISVAESDLTSARSHLQESLDRDAAYKPALELIKNLRVIE